MYEGNCDWISYISYYFYGVLQSYSDCITGGLSTRQVHVALVSVVGDCMRLSLRTLFCAVFAIVCFVPWKCICRGKVSWTASSCPCGSWKVLCLKQCRIAEVCNMSHVPAGLVGSSCWHTCMEYSKATRTASVEVCLHDRYTLR